MAYYDFYTDPQSTNDIVLTSTGDFRFTASRKESLIQRLTIRYNTWLGEWKYNTNFGAPWLQRLLKGGLSKTELDSEIRRIALEEDDVTSVQGIESTYNMETRIYTVSRLYVYCDDDIWDIPIVDFATRTNEYPEPMSYDDFVICTLDAEEIAQVNTLHSYLNNDLDIDGSAQWWNAWTTSNTDKLIVDSAINKDWDDAPADSTTITISITDGTIDTDPVTISITDGTISDS